MNMLNKLSLRRNLPVAEKEMRVNVVNDSHGAMTVYNGKCADNQINHDLSHDDDDDGHFIQDETQSENRYLSCLTTRSQSYRYHYEPYLTHYQLPSSGINYTYERQNNLM